MINTPITTLLEFIRQAPFPIALIDTENRYALASDAYLDFYRLPPFDQVKGKTVEQCFLHFKPEWREIHERGFRGEVIRNKDLAEEITLSFGGNVWVRWEVRPWKPDPSGDIKGVITSIIDVTPLVRSIQDRDQTIKAFAHDLRGLFVQICGLTELCLLGDSDSEDNAEYIEDLKVTLSFGVRLVDKLHDYAQMSRETHTLAPAKIKDVVAEAFRVSDTTLHATLNSNISDSLLIEGDSTKLVRLFGNIFSNSIKFCDGDPVIAVSATCENPPYWEIEIQDNSIGFDSDQFGYIVIQPCERLDKTKEGTGMGLAIAQKIAEIHHTSLSLASKPGKGLNVRFSLKEWGK